jgi:hypothetical protein
MWLEREDHGERSIYPVYPMVAGQLKENNGGNATTTNAAQPA